MRHRNNHRQPNWCDGPNIDEPTPGDGGYLPFEVGCPAFTHELWQVRWTSARMFKPEIPEMTPIHPARTLDPPVHGRRHCANTDRKRTKANEVQCKPETVDGALGFLQAHSIVRPIL